MRYFTLPIIIVVLSGCVSRKSVGGKPEYPDLIGLRFQTTSEVFLVKNPEYYSLEREGDVRPGPTFAQFRNGEWKNRWTNPAKYLHILPKGTILETTDVIREDHVEMGRTWEIHGIIFENTQFFDVGPVYMCYFSNPSNLIWQPSLEKMDSQP